LLSIICDENKKQLSFKEDWGGKKVKVKTKIAHDSLILFNSSTIRVSEDMLNRWSRLHFAVVSSHESPLGPHGGLRPVLLTCKEVLCPSSESINGLMMNNIRLRGMYNTDNNSMTG
jgi:hypothetical protein